MREHELHDNMHVRDVGLKTMRVFSGEDVEKGIIRRVEIEPLPTTFVPYGQPRDVAYDYSGIALTAADALGVPTVRYLENWPEDVVVVRPASWWTHFKALFSSRLRSELGREEVLIFEHVLARHDVDRALERVKIERQEVA